MSAENDAEPEPRFGDAAILSGYTRSIKLIQA